MPKYFGSIGYSETVETAPGVFMPKSVTRPYTGDVLQNHRRWDNSEHVNDNLEVSNRISILADDYAYEHIGDMRYITYLNSKWKIKSVDIQRPRIIILVGGVYNGE